MQIEYRRRPAAPLGTYASTNASIHTWARSNHRAKHRGSSLQIHPTITVSQLSPVNWIHPWTHSKLSFIIRRKMRRRTDLIWVMIPTHTRLCNAWANGTNAHSFPMDRRPASPTQRLPHRITTVRRICLDSWTLFELGKYGSRGKFSLGNQWCSLVCVPFTFITFISALPFLSGMLWAALLMDRHPNKSHPLLKRVSDLSVRKATEIESGLFFKA